VKVHEMSTRRKNVKPPELSSSDGFTLGLDA
jgi:hypothetical protein